MTAPRLSILAPFYRDDPSVLLRSLAAQERITEVEVLIMDDGTGNPTLTRAVDATIAYIALPVKHLQAPQNRGRSATRNALQEVARADWVLFLDADMRVDHPDFVARYLERIEAGDCDALFGGFTVERSDDVQTDLHRALSDASDCLSAAERQSAGPQYVASSNLCVRKTVLEADPFDAGFTGWGWEDSEWAARVHAKHRLVHLDNPAVHLGLETTDTLLARFASSGPNYRRFTQMHPALARDLPLFRIVSRLARVPGHGLSRPVLRAAVRAHALPTRLRVLALKLWRASHYAEAMRG